MLEEEIFKQFSEFFDLYKSELYEGKTSIIIDFKKIIEFNSKLADEVLTIPTTAIKLAEEYLMSIGKSLNVRFTNLPEIDKISIRSIRVKDLNKLISLTGLIRQSSDVRPQLLSVAFCCPSCGTKIHVLQDEQKVKRPTACSCGHITYFDLVDKTFIDTQRIVVEEATEDLDGDSQPKRISVVLKGDLVEPSQMRKTIPGSRIKIVGIVREVPKKVTIYDIVVEANNIELLDEDYSKLAVTDDDIKKIIEFSKQDSSFEMLRNSIAPNIFGLDEVKEALLIQLFGGVRKVRKDNTVFRNVIHLLLIGEPGCVCGDTLITLSDGTFRRIRNIGINHQDKINYKVNTLNGEKIASKFYKYQNEDCLKITTETRKELICNYNHPLLVLNTQEEWIRADKLKIGDKVKCITYIECLKTEYEELPKFDTLLQRKNIKIPNCNEEVAILCGYALGDGYIIHGQKKYSNRLYKLGLIVNEEEIDTKGILNRILYKNFGIIPKIDIRDNKYKSYIGDREIIRTQKLYYLEISSREIAERFRFVKNKEIPEFILASKKSVVSKFLSGLFEADGYCIITKRENRTDLGRIGLKSVNRNILLDTQTLLLKFGIQARVYKDNLSIGRIEDVRIFANEIGFISDKKRIKLENILNTIDKNQHKRRNKIIYEKIIRIEKLGKQTVYDIEVSNEHNFISNGIISHNTSKSSLMSFIHKSGIAPKVRYITGKTTTTAGLVASVVKDDASNNWVLEAGAVVLAHKGILLIDEIDKMDKDDVGALHEVMEQSSITVSKATIQASLKAETAITMAANPKFGRFDIYQSIADQLNLPPALINRFDLIFPLRDIPNEKRDEDIAKHILNFTNQDIKIDALFVRKYITYAKQNIFPTMTLEAENAITKYYVGLRSSYSRENKQSIPISPRQLEALVRLSEGSARARLSNKVELQDALRAIRLLEYCLRQVGVDCKTGELDIDLITTGISASKRNVLDSILRTLHKLEDSGSKIISLQEILLKTKELRLEDFDVEEALDKLEKRGDIFFPKNGFVSILR